MTTKFVANENIIIRGFRDQDVVIEALVESVVEDLYGEELMINERIESRLGTSGFYIIWRNFHPATEKFS